MDKCEYLVKTTRVGWMKSTWWMVLVGRVLAVRQCTEEALVGNLRLGAAAAQRTPGRWAFSLTLVCLFLYFFVVHYSLSPLGNQKLGKNTPLLPFFWRFLYFINQFHYFWLIFGYKLKPMSAAVECFHKNQLEFQQTVWRMWTTEETSWTESSINSSKYF